MNPFGPLLPFELTRVARKQSVIMGRCAYVAVLLVMIGFTYLSHSRNVESVGDFLFRSNMSRSALSQFGFSFFLTYAMVQFVVAIVATASAASAPLVEEKERKTLEFLLTTPLSDREIVLGKLSARVVQVITYLLAGLPVLAIMQFVGGVDPTLVAVAFAGAVLAVLSTAGVAALVSLRATSLRNAAGNTLGVVALYYGMLPLVVTMVARSKPGPLSLIDWLKVGNPFWVAADLGQALRANVRLDQLLPGAFSNYAAFHGLVALVTGGWASLRLRKIIAGQAENLGRKEKRREDGTPIRDRGEVCENHPVYWRETRTAIDGPTKTWRVLGKWLGFLFSFWPLVLAWSENRWRLRDEFITNMHTTIRVIVAIAMLASLFRVVTTAAASVARERRKKTFDELAMTQLTNRELLRQKGLAAVWSARWFAIWIAIHWAVDWFIGGTTLVAILIVGVLYAVYLFTAMKFGMFVAARQRDKRKSATSPVALLVLVLLLPWLVAVYAGIWWHDRPWYHSFMAFIFGLYPPTALGFAAYGPGDFARARSGDFPIPLFVAGFMTSLMVCLVSMRWLWRGARRRFKLLRPE